ncbi:MAG: ParA family protein [Planctomycetia bacterium]
MPHPGLRFLPMIGMESEVAAMSVVLTLLNRKGGVGKTSTCQHLAGALAKAGRRVLLCDADPQGSLTQGFFGPEGLEALAERDTIAAVFDDRLDPEPARLIRPTPFERIALVPGSDHLSKYNIPADQLGGDLGLLKDFLDEARPFFDVCLVDCPPNLQFCSNAALAASDFVLVPVQPEDYGAQGLVPVQRAIAAIRRTRHPRLRLLGYLVTLYQKTLGIHRAYEQLLRANYGDAVLTTVMPVATHFKEAVSARKPVGAYKPKSMAAKVMDALAVEVLERFKSSAAAADETTDGDVLAEPTDEAA